MPHRAGEGIHTMTTNRMSHPRLTWCARIAAAIAPVTAAAALAHGGLAVDTRYSPDTGHTYKVVTNPLPADAASAEAASEDGYLATITSPAEQSFVQNLLRRAQVPGGTYWVGPNTDGNSAAPAGNVILWGGPNHPTAVGNGSQGVAPGSGAGTKLRGYLIEFGATGSGSANGSTGGGVTGGGSTGNGATGAGGSTNSPGTPNGGGTSGSLAGGNVPGANGSGTGTGTSTGGTTTGGTTTGGTTTGGTTTGGTGSGTTSGTRTGTGGTGSTGTGTTGTGTGGNGTGTSGSGSTANGTGGTGTGTGSGTGTETGGTGGLTSGGSGSGLGGGSSGGGPAAVPLPAAVYLFPAGMALAGIAQRRMKRRR
jgi:hypothetical protein